MKITIGLFQLFLFGCCLFPAIGSLSLKPPAEEIPSKHLCPNPVLSATSKLSPSQLSKVLTIRLQPRNRSNSYFSRFRPCRFVEDPSLSSPPYPVPTTVDPNSTVSSSIPSPTLVRIQSINLNTSPWNFSASQECSKFIMFRSWSEYGNSPHPVMCGRENFDQFLGPFEYPTILYYHLRGHGMSFPLFHPNYEPLLPSSTATGSFPEQQPRAVIKYLLIYFSVRNPDGKWTCRVQQYTLNALQSSCETVTTQTCGSYPCNELNVLYEEKMGLLRGDTADLQQQRFIIVKSKAQERYRVRNFLRQKFVPIVFLVILICAYKTYMKAGLRMHDQMPMPVSESRLRRHHHHHHRHHFRDIYFDYGVDRSGSGDPVDSTLPGFHIPYEPSTPVGPHRAPHGASTYGKYLAHPSDPPPSYDTLFPPSYNDLFIPTPTAASSSSTTSSPASATSIPIPAPASTTTTNNPRV